MKLLDMWVMGHAGLVGCVPAFFSFSAYSSVSFLPTLLRVQARLFNKVRCLQERFSAIQANFCVTLCSQTCMANALDTYKWNTGELYILTKLARLLASSNASRVKQRLVDAK